MWGILGAIGVLLAALAWTTGPAAAQPASGKKLRLPPDARIDAEVDLGTTDGAYGLAARLKVSLLAYRSAHRPDQSTAAGRKTPSTS